ncbi:hypothetical protein ACET3X_003698 [Alternaria dauci]|uniref:Uncharacterized protein n=1 Tax=Alternaria dauci TaxID=48095 RepID=A0ABR3UKW6_9PLEO
MRKHVNQQHSVQLSRWSSPSAASYAEHAAQLWRPVKVQTFFRERRYVRYFIVQEQKQRQEQEQEPAQEQEQEQAQGKPQTAEQKEADSYKQRLATLSPEEASAKDRTGWFKRTQWDEHLQTYPDWRLLSYAIRLPAANEPALQHVVQLVEQLVEEAV